MSPEGVFKFLGAKARHLAVTKRTRGQSLPFSRLAARSNSSPGRCGSGGKRSNKPSRLLVGCKIVSIIAPELYDGIHPVGTSMIGKLILFPSNSVDGPGGLRL